VSALPRAATSLTPRDTKRLLKRGPDRAMEAALHTLRAGQMYRALDMFTAIAQTWPKNPKTLYFLSLNLYQSGSLATDPEYKARATELAENFMRYVVHLAPKHADAWYNLGKYCQDGARDDEALECYLEALNLAPKNSAALNNAGNLFLAAGDLDTAEHCFARALAIRTNDATAIYNRSFLKLLRGDLAGGFRDQEARWESLGFSVEYKRHFARTHPRWTGQPLGDEALLVYAEQGLGDTIQLVRYLPRVRELHGHQGPIILEVQQSLVPLVERFVGMPSDVRVIAQFVDPLPEFAAHVSLFSLPALSAERQPDAVIPPTPFPYFLAPPSPRRLGNAFGLRRVGLCWAGSRGHKGDAKRSIPFASLAPLADLPGTEWFSLQVGDRECEAGTATWIKRNHGAWTNFADTAAVIAGLDLVLTVDTAPAHLAGALGVPTWLLIPTPPDFRWQLRGDTSPWYPSVHIWRRAGGESWDDVIPRIVHALARPLSRSLERSA
jgi:tetratricopeptide (TPR) repeat protein